MTHLGPWLAYTLGVKSEGSPSPSRACKGCGQQPQLIPWSTRLTSPRFTAGSGLPHQPTKLYGPGGFSYRQGPLLKRIFSEFSCTALDILISRQILISEATGAGDT